MEVLVIEDIYLGLNSNVLITLAEIRGALFYSCQKLGISIIKVPSSRWKHYYNMPVGRQEQKARAIELFTEKTKEHCTSDDIADSFLMLEYILQTSTDFYNGNTTN